LHELWVRQHKAEGKTVDCMQQGSLSCVGCLIKRTGFYDKHQKASCIKNTFALKWELRLLMYFKILCTFIIRQNINCVIFDCEIFCLCTFCVTEWFQLIWYLRSNHFGRRNVTSIDMTYKIERTLMIFCSKISSYAVRMWTTRMKEQIKSYIRI
jgi:hypothetical protein